LQSISVMHTEYITHSLNPSLCFYLVRTHFYLFRYALAFHCFSTNIGSTLPHGIAQESAQVYPPPTCVCTASTSVVSFTSTPLFRKHSTHHLYPPETLQANAHRYHQCNIYTTLQISTSTSRVHCNTPSRWIDCVRPSLIS
jgi:hypothetical protein